MVATTIRTIFAQPGPALVREQLDEVIAGMLGRQFPPVEAMLHEAADDITAFRRLPLQPLEEDLEHQPAGTPEQGDQAAHRRRRRLSQPRSAAPPSRRRAG
jgi:hypothetical protein